MRNLVFKDKLKNKQHKFNCSTKLVETSELFKRVIVFEGNNLKTLFINKVGEGVMGEGKGGFNLTNELLDLEYQYFQ